MPLPLRAFLTLIVMVPLGLVLLGGGLSIIGRELPPGQRLPGPLDIPLVLMKPPGDASFGALESMNVLVLGIDYNQDSKGMPFSKGARSDTIFVMNLHRAGDALAMLSMPRDMYVEFPDGSHDKVNAAYSFGGVPLALQTIAKFLEIPIDHYVVLRIQGTQKLVDALGGLDIDVEKAMSYDDNWGQLHVHLKPGLQHLDGAQAVGYARFRHDEDGDRGRMRRQQQVVGALLHELRQPSHLARLEDLVRITKENLETDLDVGQLVDLARVYRGFDPHRLRTAHLDGVDSWAGPMSVILPPPAQTTRQIVAGIFNPDLPDKDVHLEVLNGSGIPGAALNLAKTLQDRGFTVVRVDNAPNHPAESYIMSHSLSQEAMQKLPRLLKDVAGDLKLMPTSASSNETVSATIVLGLDWKNRSRM